MSFTPASNVARVTIEGTYAGQEVVQVLHYKHTGAITGANLDDLLSAVQGVWEDDFLPILDANYAVIKYTAVDLTAQSNPVHTLLADPGTVGAVGGGGLPGNAAVVLTKRTAKSGRAYRGRTYIPAIAISKQDGINTIHTTFVSALLSAAANLITDPAVINFAFSVLSYFLNGSARNPALAEPITALSIDTDIDSQRRRLVGRGA